MGGRPASFVTPTHVHSQTFERAVALRVRSWGRVPYQILGKLACGLYECSGRSWELAVKRALPAEAVRPLQGTEDTHAARVRCPGRATAGRPLHAEQVV